MSNPSHAAASRISAMWKAHKAQMEMLGVVVADTPLEQYRIDCPDFGPDRGIEARRILSLPPLTPEQASD